MIFRLCAASLILNRLVRWPAVLASECRSLVATSTWAAGPLGEVTFERASAQDVGLGWSIAPHVSAIHRHCHDAVMVVLF